MKETISQNPDRLDSLYIYEAGGTCAAPVYLFDVIDSTNNYAKALVQQGVPHGTLVIANMQTAGRGRQGRSFYSPENTGLYFSIILHPEDETLISRMTPACAVAAVSAIEETAGIRCGIKWVNDLYIGKKKTAGILCEAVRDHMDGSLKAVVAGIGINCFTVEFPQELENIAGSLNSAPFSRNELAAKLRKHLLYRMEHLADAELMDLYRRDSIVLGKEITWIKDKVPYSGTAIQINDEGNLIVKLEDGSTQVLMSGEVSVRER